MENVGADGQRIDSEEKMTLLKAIAANGTVMLVFRLILAAFFLVSSYGKLVDIERYSALLF